MHQASEDACPTTGGNGRAEGFADGECANHRQALPPGCRPEIYRRAFLDGKIQHRVTGLFGSEISGVTVMKAKRIMFYCLAGLMVGCVPVVSLHPLFTREDIVFDRGLLGTWTGDVNNVGTAWEFTPFEQSAAEGLPKPFRSEFKSLYRLAMSDRDGYKGSLAACLVKLNNRLFLDIFPDKFPSGESNVKRTKLLYNAYFFLPGHTFVRVDSIGSDSLKFHLTDDDAFDKLMDAEPKAIEYTETEERPILTASTKELQAFVMKYADDTRLFPTELTLTRKAK
jgi:hypothetical protein